VPRCALSRLADVRLAVFVSGSGTILRAIFDAELPVTVVLADRPCVGLDLARERGVPTELVDRREYGGFGSDFDREAYSLAVAGTLVENKIDLVAMAGFGTILGQPVYETYAGRILNTHPSLLPAFPGWHAVRDALEAGVSGTGCTVHLATLAMDAGPILAQQAVRVVPGDTEESLHEAIKVTERALYPEIIAWAMGELEAGRAIEPRREEVRPPIERGMRRKPPREHRERRGRSGSQHAWRMATAQFRPLPDIVILGTQRGGTTSLRRWLSESPAATYEAGEVHYLDHNYERGRRWYRAQFPTFRERGRRIESSPYLLFHPLAPERAVATLPESTRFVVLLREPADRAMSHYRLERSFGRESKSFADALAAEDERLAGETEKVLRGERSRSHQWFSYRARGRYAEQVARWQDAVGPDRVKVVESERLYVDPEVGSDLLGWLGLPAAAEPFPATNASPEPRLEDKAPLGDLRAQFEQDNEALFKLLGRRFWGD
jgi:phosphoribosylglycinamide formyltransferase-1